MWPILIDCLNQLSLQVFIEILYKLSLYKESHRFNLIEFEIDFLIQILETEDYRPNKMVVVVQAVAVKKFLDDTPWLYVYLLHCFSLKIRLI